MTTRSVIHVLYAHEFDMGGLTVRQPFPSPEVRQIDPFILLHHANISIPKETDLANAGVGPHPHRGFSPVTFIFEGGVHHRDSRGHESTIYAGGTQWMNAGAGIMHSERPPLDIHSRGSRQEIIQMWVNTPQSHKNDDPKYIPLTKEDTPKFVSEDGQVEAYVQAGSLFGLQGPIPSTSPVNAATIYLKKDAVLSIPLPKTHNAFIFLLDGRLNVAGHGDVAAENAVVFDRDGEGVTITATEPTRILLMSGEPIGEPVAMYGPFVMNTQGELRQAFIDLQLGKFGSLEE